MQHSLRCRNCDGTKKFVAPYTGFDSRVPVDQRAGSEVEVAIIIDDSRGIAAVLSRSGQADEKLPKVVPCRWEQTGGSAIDWTKLLVAGGGGGGCGGRREALKGAARNDTTGACRSLRGVRCSGEGGAAGS